MCKRLFVAALFVGLLNAAASASGKPAMAFVDGRWQGGVKSDPEGSGFEECWASTDFADGTVFTLSKRKDGAWRLRLANMHWQLPESRRYAMVTQVDFYPKLNILAEARNRSLLEIADIDRISLLTLIENGHTIDLVSDGFKEKYELEGSAKIIERIRNCFDQSADEKPAADKGQEP